MQLMTLAGALALIPGSVGMLASLLNQAGAADPGSLIAVTAILNSTGVLAALLPALRASRTNAAQFLGESP